MPGLQEQRLNWVEAEFAAVRYFALNGSDHRSRAERDAAISAYVRRCNQRAKPKPHSAPAPRSTTRITPVQGCMTRH
ncbi:hypothetical protein O7627_36855 [Solwaraspora sp. WMMD1047]|uniref:hypothetical protein n=1 Tax=Solwaraspora sp. WMMD1047 TaxID=3016102 RepID=UPI002416DFB9|nr:hypothetical protein [Solwaraspora sp. WMMD1047]MDG4834841.1 hypothetical protein [Solwaraspora sp. WMMD1047]